MKQNKEALKKKKRDYYLKNKDKILIKAKVYRDKNQDKIKIYLSNWRSENPEYSKRYSKEYGSEYYQKNKEKIRENQKVWEIENKEKRNKQRRIFRKNNPEVFKIRDLLNNIRQRSVISPDLSREQIVQIFERDDGCVYCRKETNLTIDHIIPLTKGGRNIYANLVIACVSCNCSKNNRDVFEWCNWKGYEVPEIVKLLLGGLNAIYITQGA